MSSPLQQLHGLTEAALAHLRLDDLLGDVVRRLRTILPTDAAAVLLLVEGGARLHVHASEGSGLRPGARIPTDRCFAGRVATRGQSLVFDDLEPGDLGPVVGRDMQALLGAPLIVRNEVIGVVQVGRQSRRRFSIIDMRLLEHAADRIALAIDRARLYEAEQRARADAEAANARLRLLAEASELLGASLDERGFRPLVQLLVPAVADLCVIDLLDDDGPVVAAAAVVGPDGRPRCLETAAADRPPLVEQVLATSCTVVLPDPDAMDGEPPAYGGVTLGALVSLPLSGRDRPLGALTLAQLASGGRRFSPPDTSLALELARRAGQALDNARLFREARGASNAHRRALALLDALLDAAPVGLAFFDPELRFVLINEALAAYNGLPVAAHLGRRPSEIIGGVGQRVEALMAKVLASGRGFYDRQFEGVTPDEPSTLRHWSVSIYPVDAPTGERLGVGAVVADVTERVRAQQLLEGQRRVLELIARGNPLGEVLDALALLIEEHTDGALCSVLVVDDDGAHLRLGAAPSLPTPYNQAVDGLPIRVGVGSCGTAAATAQAVVVTDIASDPRWAPYRDTSLAHGLAACWSTPIRGYEGGDVLGTFALYYRVPRAPTEREQQLVERATSLAAIAIESRPRQVV